jgi:hypothetical protein
MYCYMSCTAICHVLQVRKVVTTLELATTLLQLLEFLATNVPEAFLSPSCTLNLTRLGALNLTRLRALLHSKSKSYVDCKCPGSRLQFTVERITASVRQYGRSLSYLGMRSVDLFTACHIFINTHAQAYGGGSICSGSLLYWSRCQALE